MRPFSFVDRVAATHRVGQMRPDLRIELRLAVGKRARGCCRQYLQPQLILHVTTVYNGLSTSSTIVINGSGTNVPDAAFPGAGRAVLAE